MTQESTAEQERSLYIAAAKIINQADRKVFLQEACDGDVQLQRRVEHLLAAKEAGQDNLLRRALHVAGKDSVGGFKTAPAFSLNETGAEIHSSEINIDQHPIIDRYKLLEEIGHGGMGTVYMAEQTEPVRRRVAVKVINPGMNTREVLTRFEAERQALAIMDHPNIARVIDGGTTESGLPYFVMELVDGAPLTEYCRVKKLSLTDRLNLFIDVCNAVQHAHQKGIIHRDLKPGNILAAARDDRTLIKVIDFGVAKALNQSLTDKTLFTRFSAMIGTPLYMSPEQTRMSNVDVDTRSDVYSLGVILYELLTGKPPFDRQALAEVGLDEFRKIVADQVPDRPSSRISTLRQSSSNTIEDDCTPAFGNIEDSVTAELDWIVLKSLEKDRERRYESAKALADDVQRFIKGETVLACPPTFRYRMRKFLSRNRVPVGIAAFACSTLSFLVLSSMWQVRQVNQAWHESRARERQATDLLEALQLQSSVSAFRRSDFSSIPELLGSKTALTKLGSNQGHTGYFQRVLIDAAKPRFDNQVSIGCEISDSVWDQVRECLWILDVNGNFYRVDDATWYDRGNTEGLVPVGSVGQTAQAIAISPDSKTLVIGTALGQLCFWTLGERPDEFRRVQLGTHGVESIVWSPDGRYVVSGTRYEAFWVGKPDGETLFRVANDHRHESFVFLPDAKQGEKCELLVSTRQGIDVYRLPDGTKERSIAMGQHIDAREMILAGENGNWLVACGTSLQSMLVVDTATGKHLGVIPLKSKYPQSLAVLNNGRWIAAVFPDGLLQIVSLSQKSDGQVSGTPIACFYVDAPGRPSEKPRLRVLAVSDQDTLMTTATRGAIRRWTLDNVLPVQTIRPPSPLNAAYAVAANELDFFYKKGFAQKDRDCDRALPRGLGVRSVRPIGEAIHHPLVCFSRGVSDSGWIACAGSNHVTIYDLFNRKVVRTLTTTLERVYAVEISPNGDSVAVHRGGLGGAMAWHSADGWRTATQQLDFDGVVDGVFCFADKEGHSCLIWDDHSQSIHSLEMQNRTQRVLFEQSSDKFKAAAISNDGQRLAIGSVTGINVIDLATSESTFGMEELEAVHGVCFLPENRILLSGHESGHVRAWHLSTGQALGVLVEPKRELGTPSHFMVFPDQHRLLINYHRHTGVTPLLIGTSKLID